MQKILANRHVKKSCGFEVFKIQSILPIVSLYIKIWNNAFLIGIHILSAEGTKQGRVISGFKYKGANIQGRLIFSIGHTWVSTKTKTRSLE